MARLIVTVDGPSGTGKSTVSKAVAERSSLPHLDTGAFYRAATLVALRRGVDVLDGPAVAEAVRAVRMDQVGGRMYLDGEDVSDAIRGENVTGAVSAVSAHSEVRRLLVDLQRRWVENHGSRAVVEGRDIGSVVFPEAGLKIYLDASAEIRARRRALQVGDDPTRVIGDLERRDRYDSGRSVSPLRVPEDAVVIDTSDMSFEEVVERVLGLIEALA